MRAEHDFKKKCVPNILSHTYTIHRDKESRSLIQQDNESYPATIWIFSDRTTNSKSLRMKIFISRIIFDFTRI